jgi:hypothetical protein
MQSKDFLTCGFMSIKWTGPRRTRRKGFSILLFPFIIIQLPSSQIYRNQDHSPEAISAT